MDIPSQPPHTPPNGALPPDASDHLQTKDHPNFRRITTIHTLGYLCAAFAFIALWEGALRLHYQRALLRLHHRAQMISHQQAVAAHRSVFEQQAVAARWSVSKRNALKYSVRMWDLDFIRIMAERRNLAKYGHRLGPTYQQLRKKYSDAAILRSVRRTNQQLNTLALLLLAISGCLFLCSYTLARTARSHCQLEQTHRFWWRWFVDCWLAGLLGYLLARGCDYALGSLGGLFGNGPGEPLGAILGAIIGVFFAAYGIIARYGFTARFDASIRK